MEDHMSRLFDLIASRSFEELSSEERGFVLSQISEGEFRLQRSVLASTQELHYDEVEALPLVLPNRKQSVLSKTIPLYQAVIGAACLTIGVFLFADKKSNALDFRLFENPIEISLTNAPVEVKYIHDTILERLQIKSPVQFVRDTVTMVQTVFVNKPEMRVLEAGNSLNTIPLNKNLLEVKSLSAKDDGSIGLLPKINDYSSMK